MVHLPNGSWKVCVHSDPSLHQGMEWLVIGTTLGRRQRENEALEACIVNLSSDDVWKGIVPRAGSTEVPSTFEGVGVELKEEQGSVFLLFHHFSLCHLS